MSHTAPQHSVVVGVDGSRPSSLALAWACREATRTRRPLHLIHAYSFASPYAGAGAFSSLSLSDLTWLESAAERTLAEAVSSAEALSQGVDITSAVVAGSEAAALVEASRTASEVVVGSRGRGELASAVLGSVSLQVAMHAHAPVVVVKDREDPDRPRDGVTVGIDGFSDSQACLAYAFEQASSRGTRLDVVHAWAPERSSRPGGLAEAFSADYEVEPRRELLVAEALAGWAERYPDVHVQRTVAHSHAVDALVEAADGAQLLVVGSRGRGGFAGLLLGSVSHGVLQHAGCPVAVVRQTDAG